MTKHKPTALRQWMKQHRLDCHAFAKLLTQSRGRVARATDVSEMAKGCYLPGWVTANEIAKATRGGVPVESWGSLGCGYRVSGWPAT
jgi:hypothetical protein